jgi:voltage-gated potassium channel Kch
MKNADTELSSLSPNIEDTSTPNSPNSPDFITEPHPADYLLNKFLLKESVEDHHDWLKILGKDKIEKAHTIREKIYTFFSEPRSSIGALIWTAIVVGTVIESTIAFIIWTNPQYYAMVHNVVFDSLEIYAIVIFTVDYFARLLTCPDLKAFLIDFLNFIDFLSILPFYVELIVVAVYGDLNIASLSAIRIVRLFRVIRIVKISKYTHSAGLLSKTLKNSREAFLMLFFTLILAMILYASLVFYAEQTEEYFDNTTDMWIYNDGVISQFQSISDGMWFCLSTLVTVGYGDIVPRTFLGKVVAGVTMLTGIIVVLAIPISIFSANFNEVYKEYQVHKRRAAIAVMRKQQTKIFTTSVDTTSGNGKIESFTLPTQIEQIRKLKEEQLYLNETIASLRTTLKDIEVRNRVINNLVDVILTDSEEKVSQEKNQKK